MDTNYLSSGTVLANDDFMMPPLHLSLSVYGTMATKSEIEFEVHKTRIKNVLKAPGSKFGKRLTMSCHPIHLVLLLTGG